MSTDTITLSSPASLVASLPHIIGFTPTDSVIIVWLKEGRLLVTQRADLEDALGDVEGMLGPIRKHEPDEAIIVVWSDHMTTQAEVADLVAQTTAMSHLRDALWVCNGRWGSINCTDDSCCPVGGRLIDDVSAPVELVLDGRSPVDNRESLIREYEPNGYGTMNPIVLKDAELETWRDEMIDLAIDGFYDDDPEVEDIYRIGRALHDIRVRDTLLWEMTALSPADRLIAREKAARVCRAMRLEDAAPALTFAAICAWLTGDGARANVALGFAEQSNPDYSLAALVRLSLASGLPPTQWEDAMKNLTREQTRHGR